VKRRLPSGGAFAEMAIGYVHIDLLKSKEARKPIVAPEAPRPTNLVNLMDALRKSIDSEKPVASKKGSVQDECRSIRCQRRRDGV